jgi:hypothetical protein
MWHANTAITYSTGHHPVVKIKITLGHTFEVSVVTVPLSALVHPLCVIPDYGGDKNSLIVVLPKRNWTHFFGDKIERQTQ